MMLILVNDAGETLKDMNVIIPEVKDTLKMVYRLCQFEKFYYPLWILM